MNAPVSLPRTINLRATNLPSFHLSQYRGLTPAVLARAELGNWSLLHLVKSKLK